MSSSTDLDYSPYSLLFQENLQEKNFYRAEKRMGLYKPGIDIALPLIVIEPNDIFFLVEKRINSHHEDRFKFLVIFKDLIGEISPAYEASFYLVTEDEEDETEETL